MYFMVYLAAVNVLAFLLMGADKRRARQGRWRISEGTLFFSAILVGSAGAILGMYLFRHKTRHWYFVIGMPLVLAAQLLIGFLLWRRGILPF